MNRHPSALVRHLLRGALAGAAAVTAFTIPGLPLVLRAVLLLAALLLLRGCPLCWLAGLPAAWSAGATCRLPRSSRTTPPHHEGSA